MMTPLMRTSDSRPSGLARVAGAGAVLTPDAPAGRDLRAEALSLFAQGEVDAAVLLLQRGLTDGSADPQGWNELGNMLAHLGRPADAASAFRRALGRSPRSAALWNNLGAVLLQDAHPVGAECAFRRAIALEEGFHQAHQNLAQLLEARGDLLEAARHHCLAFVHGPRQGKSWSMLGLAYYQLGEMESAAAIYRLWLDEEPGNPVARHRLASCLREGVPARVSDEYVEATFDAFAPTFDEHLRGLGYQGPELIAAALDEALGDARIGRLLDLGCGTGLCATVLHARTTELHGVDLSAAMLERAEARGLYHRLDRAEITRHLATVSTPYDVICAADTFNYFGELYPLFEGAAAALVPGGRLVFTVEDGDERCDAQGWHLAMHGRYLHASNALARWLMLAGFALDTVRGAPLRRELGQDVPCRIYTARRV